MSRQRAKKSQLSEKKLSPQNTLQLQSRAFGALASPQQSTNFNFGQTNLFPEKSPPPYSASMVQPKLTIGQPGDKYEQEADQVAKQVVQQINSPQTPQTPDNIQRSSLVNSATSSPVQRQSSIPVGPASNNFEQELSRARSGGKALDSETKEQMGTAIGADFTGVKIHTDARADHLNRSIQSRAFTTGQDVFFKQGEYNPHNQRGQELIAHELTHVVQQSSGQVQRQTQALIQRANLNVRIPSPNEPETDEKVFDAPPDYFEGEIGGETFKIYAGQTFLNDEKSATYKADKSEIKGGSATLVKPLDADRHGYGDDVRAIGDGHHRFIWSAYHGDPVKAKKKMGFVGAQSWKDLTYRSR